MYISCFMISWVLSIFNRSLSILIVSQSSRNSRTLLPYQKHIVQLFKHILQYMLSKTEPSVYLTYIYIIKASFPRFNIMFTSVYFEQSSYLYKLEDGSFPESDGFVWTMNFARLKDCFSRNCWLTCWIFKRKFESATYSSIAIENDLPSSQSAENNFSQQQKRRSSSNFRETFSANFQSSKTVIREKFFAVFSLTFVSRENKLQTRTDVKCFSSWYFVFHNLCV